jgi:ribosomal silencing factor RsfS
MDGSKSLLANREQQSMEDDIIILVGDSLEQVRALAEGKYDILYERRFGTVDTDSANNDWGTIAANSGGALAVAKWLD